MFSGENDLPKLGDDLQNELDMFVKMREMKKQKEIEQKKMLEMLAEQKRKEEEELLQKKKEEERAAAEAEAQRVLKIKILSKFIRILIKTIFFKVARRKKVFGDN